MTGQHGGEDTCSAAMKAHGTPSSSGCSLRHPVQKHRPGGLPSPFWKEEAPARAQEALDAALVAGRVVSAALPDSPRGSESWQAKGIFKFAS